MSADNQVDTKQDGPIATSILLTLNGERREIEANVRQFYDRQELIVYGIAVITSHGKSTHRGTLRLKPNEANEYTLKDVCGIYYHGMRGNGRAMRSHFRHVGFFPAD
jgi:hypothetical protein